MTDTCSQHGELKEKVKQAEDRIECIEHKQQELRKPEDGALAKIHEKINTRATREDVKGAQNAIAKYIAAMVTIFLFIIGGSFGYTRSIDAKMADSNKKIEEMKERLDREVVTKQDLQCLKQELKDLIKDIRAR